MGIRGEPVRRCRRSVERSRYEHNRRSEAVRHEIDLYAGSGYSCPRWRHHISGLPSPAGSSGLPADIGRAALNRPRRSPPRGGTLLPCSGWGLPSHPGHPGAGGLLPHRSPLPGSPPEPASVAVCFCGTVPRVAPVAVSNHPALWSRTFLGGLRGGRRDRRSTRPSRDHDTSDSPAQHGYDIASQAMSLSQSSCCWSPALPRHRQRHRRRRFPDHFPACSPSACPQSPPISPTPWPSAPGNLASV